MRLWFLATSLLHQRIGFAKALPRRLLAFVKHPKDHKTPRVPRWRLAEVLEKTVSNLSRYSCRQWLANWSPVQQVIEPSLASSLKITAIGHLRSKFAARELGS